MRDRLRRGIQAAARKAILLQAIDERAPAEPQPAGGLGLISGHRGERTGNDAPLESLDLFAQTEAGIDGRLRSLLGGIGHGGSRDRLRAPFDLPSQPPDAPPDRGFALAVVVLT